MPWVAIQPNGLGGGAGLVGCGRHFGWLGGKVGMLVMDGKVGGGMAGKRQVPEAQEGGTGAGMDNGMLANRCLVLVLSGKVESAKQQKKVKQVSRRPGSIKCINVHFFQIF